MRSKVIGSHWEDSWKGKRAKEMKVYGEIERKGVWLKLTGGEYSFGYKGMPKWFFQMKNGDRRTVWITISGKQWQGCK